MGWLSDLLRGGSGELGWDDLIRRIVDALAALRRYGPRGEAAFPADAVVRITVPEGSAAVVQGFLDRPELDREVAAGLANRCDVAEGALPAREYVVSVADRASVTASEGAPRTWRVAIAGGDLDGTTLALPAGWSELAFGRGPWHGADHGARNDLVVCERTEFVSRRAGRLYRAGHQLEVASLDQGDELVVRRASGEAVRPARTARGRATVRDADAIELGDGRGGDGGLRLTFRRQ
ncbi:MAG TPA: hypothetical protein VK932_01875 [Kofleriaceae bacterium]|nr:hypothetical protein [Kofleriaceae bacterium]